MNFLWHYWIIFFIIISSFATNYWIVSPYVSVFQLHTQTLTFILTSFMKDQSLPWALEILLHCTEKERPLVAPASYSLRTIAL